MLSIQTFCHYQMWSLNATNCGGHIRESDDGVTLKWFRPNAWKSSAGYMGTTKTRFAPLATIVATVYHCHFRIFTIMGKTPRCNCFRFQLYDSRQLRQTRLKKKVASKRFLSHDIICFLLLQAEDMVDANLPRRK